MLCDMLRAIGIKFKVANVNPLLRALLVQASWAALRFDWARHIYKRVCRGSAKRRKIAIIAVARHLLMRCWAMLRDNKPWHYKIDKVA